MNEMIKIAKYEEHEDGSATVEFECSSEAIETLVQQGFVRLLENTIKQLEIEENEPNN
ncbi:MAG: hypothetical protein ACPGC3_06555 [Paracoccaceae bacterium]